MTGRASAAFGVELPVSLAFEHPTLSGFALAVVTARASVDSAATERLLAELEALGGLGGEDPGLTQSSEAAGNATADGRGSE